MSSTETFNLNSLATPQTMHPGPLMETLIACANVPDATSSQRLAALAQSNNPCFWDSKIRSEQWFDNKGLCFSILFPAMLVLNGKHSRIDPYFTLPTLRQPEIKDVHTQEGGKHFDVYLSPDGQHEDKCEVIQFMWNGGSSGTDPLHFVVHTEPLFPEAAVSMQEVVPEFSLEDFENTNVTFTGDVLKQQFSGKKEKASACSFAVGKGKCCVVSWECMLMGAEVDGWTIKGMPDPQGHFKTVEGTTIQMGFWTRLKAQRRGNVIKTAEDLDSYW
ncbi:uncharacterized protein F5147DRAFT_772061 [Suillus discolor]|uniref:Uncharacterized protein n=1 Tax=Suillus discolor TaxID=1912936 RepID=A0A9P7JW81_9AGAM|nr:uncharacterized protein F5147DRAFT_772061 [Suillus discolor]KAG2111344.1 hypothetical protein F5147DRAFT_772061 [Suillus discolor]